MRSRAGRPFSKAAPQWRRKRSPYEGSFFSIRERVAKILPEPLTTGPMRTLPILLLFGAMFYWLWRVRSRRALPVLVRHDSMPLTPPAE
jgi:hypothetical protein